TSMGSSESAGGLAAAVQALIAARLAINSMRIVVLLREGWKSAHALPASHVSRYGPPWMTTVMLPVPRCVTVAVWLSPTWITHDVLLRPAWSVTARLPLPICATPATLPLPDW